MPIASARKITVVIAKHASATNDTGDLNIMEELTAWRFVQPLADGGVGVNHQNVRRGWKWARQRQRACLCAPESWDGRAQTDLAEACVWAAARIRDRVCSMSRMESTEHHDSLPTLLLFDVRTGELCVFSVDFDLIRLEEAQCIVYFVKDWLGVGPQSVGQFRQEATAVLDANAPMALPINPR
jgi:hypothetical protein